MNRNTANLVVKLADSGYKNAAMVMIAAHNRHTASSMPKFQEQQSVVVTALNTDATSVYSVSKTFPGTVLLSTPTKEIEYQWTGEIFEEVGTDYTFSIPVAITPL